MPKSGLAVFAKMIIHGSAMRGALLVADRLTCGLQ